MTATSKEISRIEEKLMERLRANNKYYNPKFEYSVSKFFDFSQDEQFVK
jgi:hypothetical protein